MPHASGITHHPNGVLEALTYQNGFVKTVGLTDRQLITPIRVDKGAVKAVHLAYAHDKNGRITIMDNHAVAGQNRAFAYDGNL